MEDSSKVLILGKDNLRNTGANDKVNGIKPFKWLAVSLKLLSLSYGLDILFS